jgi:hypothetical protein
MATLAEQKRARALHKAGLSAPIKKLRIRMDKRTPIPRSNLEKGEEKTYYQGDRELPAETFQKLLIGEEEA